MQIDAKFSESVMVLTSLAYYRWRLFIITNFIVSFGSICTFFTILIVFPWICPASIIERVRFIKESSSPKARPSPILGSLLVVSRSSGLVYHSFITKAGNLWFFVSYSILSEQNRRKHSSLFFYDDPATIFLWHLAAGNGVFLIIKRAGENG